MVYQIVLINGKIIEFMADEYDFEDGTYTFLIGGEIVGQFQKNNIAGFYAIEIEDDEKDEI